MGESPWANKIETIANNIKFVYESGVRAYAGNRQLNISTASSTTLTRSDVEKSLDALNAEQGTTLTLADIEVLTIPETISYVYGNALIGLSNARVIIPAYRKNNISSVGRNAFNNCVALGELDLRNCLSLGANFIKGCNSLKNLWLSESVYPSCLKSAFQDIPESVLKKTVYQTGSTTSEPVIYICKYVGSVKNALIYLHDAAPLTSNGKFQIPYETKYLRHISSGFEKIDLDYGNAIIEDNILSEYEGKSIDTLTLNAGFSGKFLSQYLNTGYSYDKNSSLSLKKLIIKYAELSHNALRNADVTELTLDSCYLGINSCFEMNSLKILVLKNLQKILPNSIRYCNRIEIVDASKIGSKYKYHFDGAVSEKIDGNKTRLVATIKKYFFAYTLTDNIIGSGSVAEMYNLGTVRIDSGVEEIEAPFLRNCGSLQSIVLNNNNTSFVVEKNILYTSDYTALIRALPGSGEINGNTKRIYNCAFNNLEIQSDVIEIPKSVEEIGNSAFEGATLVKLKVPAGKLYNQAVSTKCFGAKYFKLIESY